MKNRISKHEMFIEIMKIIAKRSTCLRRQVSAVLVKDGHIISTGYNGAPRKVKSCLEYGKCLREKVKSGINLEHCLAAHAETNAISQAAYHGIATKGATLYSYYSPCNFCAKSIINAGIKEVFYVEKYSDEFGIKMLKEAGVKLEKL
jgi:dCMP deaminase